MVKVRKVSELTALFEKKSQQQVRSHTLPRSKSSRPGIRNVRNDNLVLKKAALFERSSPQMPRSGSMDKLSRDIQSPVNYETTRMYFVAREKRVGFFEDFHQ